MTETSKKNNKALVNLNEKLLGKMNDRGILASYLRSPLTKNTKPEHTSQFKLVKDSQSKRVNDPLNKTKTITLYDTLWTFRDTDKKIELKGDHLEMITNENYGVDLAILPDKKLMFEFGKEKRFEAKALFNKSTRDKTVIKLPKSLGIMVSASGVSSCIETKSFSKPMKTKTKFFSSNPNEFCDESKSLLQEKRAGNIMNKVIEEMVIIVDELLE